MKYGFVYIWRDKKRKMYYIGCHWGTEDDGYICSSNRMRDAYRRRPVDFKRRIIAKVETTRQDLMEEEFKWMQLIPENELGKRYYNLRNQHFGHWTAISDEERKLNIKEKISRAGIGRISNAKGRNIEEIYGVERAKLLREKMSKSFKGIKRSKEFKNNVGKYWSRTWNITTPQNEKITVTNLKQFCKDNNVSYEALKTNNQRKPGTTYKGWLCVKEKTNG